MWHYIRARFEVCIVLIVLFKWAIGSPCSEALRRSPKIVNLNKVFLNINYFVVILDAPRYVLKPLGKFMVTGLR